MKRLFRRLRRRTKRVSDALIGALAIGVLKTVRMVDPDKMADLADNKKLLMATAAFHNEPFSSGSC